MHSLKTGIPLTAGLFLLLTASSGRLAAEDVKRKDIYDRTVRATTLVLAADGTGSGWIVDHKRRLMVTNYHVVGDADTVRVIFPLRKGGQVIAERRYYAENAKPVLGRVLDIDSGHDLALVKLEAVPAGTAQLRPAAESVGPTDSVHALGSPGRSDALWVYSSGTVRSVYDKRWTMPLHGPKRLVPLAARVVETQLPLNPGDSGGPVVNDRGELVAVTHGGAAGADLINWAIDVSEVRAFVATVLRLQDPRTAADFNERAVRLHNRGRYDRAIADYTEAIRLDPKFARAYVNRAIAYNAKGDRDTAIADSDEALRLDPRSAAAYNERGAAHSAKGDPGRAIADYTRAIQNEPGNPLYHANRGHAYAGKGDYARAIADYDEALKRDPGYTSALVLRGLAHYSGKDYAAAEADYARALRQDPLDARAHNYRGNALLALKRYEPAFDAYTEALRLGHPEPAVVHSNRGDVFWAVKNYDRAIADYTEAIRLDPKLAKAYFDRGAALEEKGRVDLAQADYDKAVELDPGVDKHAPRRPWKHLRVVNNTGQPLNVHVYYEARTKGGGWRWFPDKPLFYSFAPGEAGTLSEGDWVIKARRVRIWAEGKTTGGQWYRNKDKDLWLLEGKGYRARQPLTYTLTFTP
jgi:tetratricopeptide (TPR) repeat protein